MGAIVVISIAPEKAINIIIRFIRILQPQVFRIATRRSPVSLLGDSLFRSQNYSSTGSPWMSFSIAGKGEEVVKKCSGTVVPERSAWVIKVMASPVLGGTTTVAANCPLRTHVWPVAGTPSQPVMGIPSQ